MLNKKVILSFIVLLIQLFLIGCPNGSLNGGTDGKTNGTTNDPSDFDGTWISEGTIPGINMYMKIIAYNGDFEEYIADSIDASEWMKVLEGTYPKNAQSSITATIIRVNLIIVDGITDEWKTWSQLESETQTMLGGQIQTITITDGQFETMGLTFKRLDD